MKSEDKTKKQPVNELIGLRQRVAELEKSEIERKRVEEELLKSYRQQNAILNNIPDIAWLKDKESRFIAVNRPFAEACGVSPEELVGKTDLDIWPQELAQRYRADDRDVMATGRRKQVEEPLVDKEGKKTWIETIKTPIYDDRGEVIGTTGIARDVTKRKWAEEELRRKTYDLGERIKELNCLYTISNLIEKQDISLEEVLRGVIELIPPAYQYPEITCARVIFEGQEFRTDNFKETIWNQRSDIIVLGEQIGYLEVFCHLEEKPESADGPFLKEERSLINAIAERLGELTIRKRAEETLRRAYDELEISVQKRTAELARANEALQAKINEHKKAERALQESEARYRELAESIGEVFYAMDRDLRYTHWNSASEALTGILAKDAVGKSLLELFPELKGSRAQKLYMEVLKTQQPERFINKYRVGGKSLFFEINAYPSKFGISVIAKDITERKRAEEKVLEQAALLDKARDAIALQDLERKIIYWNKGSERLYGWIAEEVIGRNADKLLHKEESPQLIEAKKRIVEEGEWTGEQRQITKEGKEIIVESRWTLVHDSKGKPKSVLVINTDITEKKNLETQLLRAQRLESIGTLASGIAHDINNVLSPIMMSLQLLKEKYTDDESQKLLNILEKSAQRGAGLVKQVQSFARGVEGERVALQVAHLISEIRQIIKETFPRSIEVRIDMSRDLWTISGDFTQLHQVLMNLCVNARDAMPDGGVLSISAENIFIDENYARINIDAKVGQYILIVVSDTGTGIPPEIIDRIFDPFFTTKEHGKGTGLGLSTALAIVKSHGGFINVYSEVGKGTAFKIYLPAVRTITTRKAEEQIKLPAGRGELVLVVDDETQIREITSLTLATYGYRVLTASDGAEAISVYTQNRDKIRVVLMDMMMPVMGGAASIRELRKVNPEVKIVAVSGLTGRNKLSRVAITHIQAFLPKPYTTERLLKTIYEVISTE